MSIKKMPNLKKKKKVEPDDPKQSARFIEAAERIENPDAKKAFKEALYFSGLPH